MMNTLERLKWALLAPPEVLTDVEDENMSEGEQAEVLPLGTKQGNFPFKYLPLLPPLRVRGETYRLDHVKVPSGAHKFDCIGVEVFAHKKSPGNITSQWQDGQFPALHRFMQLNRYKLIVHFLIPGSPQLTASMYFAAREGVLEDDSKFARLFQKFVSDTLPDGHGNETREAADAYRTRTFKFIPRFVRGASMAKRMAGEKPAIICRKIPSRYYVGKDFLEINLDISGSRIAGIILGLVKKQLKGMVLDMVYLLEGRDASELPEEIISGVRIYNPRLDNVPRFSERP